jgi:hypothetical protein
VERVEFVEFVAMFGVMFGAMFGAAPMRASSRDLRA